jgi:hypothetical protein
MSLRKMLAAQGHVPGSKNVAVLDMTHACPVKEDIIGVLAWEHAAAIIGECGNGTGDVPATRKHVPDLVLGQDAFFVRAAEEFLENACFIERLAIMQGNGASAPFSHIGIDGVDDVHDGFTLVRLLIIAEQTS